MYWLLLLPVFFQISGPRGSIEGIVMTRGTALEQLLPNARLELSEGPGTPIVVRSDAGGKFIFPNLAPGRYRLLLTEDGFIRQEYGQRSLGGAGTPINVADGQSVKNVVFRLDAAPIIAGRVQDEFGYPVSNILVQVLRRTFDVRGKAGFTLFASALSDDRGQYRIFWVDPGEYFARAMQLVNPDDPDPQTSAPTFAPTYYPGVTDPEAARSSVVDIAREVRIDFRVRRQGPAKISGNLSQALTGKPVAGTVRVIPVEDANTALYRGQSNAAGSFSIQNVVPGSYLLSATAMSGETLGAFARIRIPSVRDFELQLTLLLGPPLQFGGRLTAGSSSLPDLRASAVNLIPVETGFPSPPKAVLRAGQFVLTDVWPGEYVLSISGLPDDVYMQAANYGGSDALAGMTVRNGPSSALEVLLATDGGHIGVTVVDRDNQLFPTAQLVLVPDAARRGRPDQYRVAVAGEDGRAVFRGIPPGDYKLFAWEGLEPNAYLNPDYMRAYEELGVPVQIKSGENDAVAARVISAGR